jgi:hypothetical protein
VDSKGSRKRLDRRQEPLLQADPDEFSLSATTDGFTLQPPAAQLAVIRQLRGEHELRRCFG